MRLIRHIALAAGAVALTGCGLNSTSADTSPTSTTTTRAPAASTPAAQEHTTPRTTPTQSPSPEEDSSSAPATPASSSPPVVTYSDKTGLLQLPVSNASLPGSPAGLRDFARAQLKQMWHDQFQDDPGCEGIAQVRIKRASTAAAYVDASWGATTPTCPQYAGNPGSWAVWGNDGGTWSVELDGSGLAACADLIEHAIPRSIYPTCSNGAKKIPNPVA